jgi:hypothetical protein
MRFRRCWYGVFWPAFVVAFRVTSSWIGLLAAA